jgi:hypothetical protein
MATHDFTKLNEKAENFSKNIKKWARIVFDLSEDETVMVSELGCNEPFCPDIMTLIAFWDENELRKEYRIYKQMRFISQNDIQEAKFSMLNVMINKELAENHKKK